MAMNRWRRDVVGLDLFTVGILLYSFEWTIAVEQFTKAITFDILDAFAR